MVAQLPSLLHVASCHKIGLTNQEVERAIAFQNIGKFKFMVVSGEKEQIQGLKERLLEHHIQQAVIIGLDDHVSPVKLVRECIKLLKKNFPDIIVLTTNWHLCIFGIAKLFVYKKPKLVYTIHGFRNHNRVLSPIFQLLISLLLFVFASLVIAPTNWVAKKFTLVKSKLVIIPLGVSKVFFGKYIKPDFSLPITFVFAANFREGKNHEVLIQTFVRYFQENNPSSVKLCLPGSGDRLQSMQSHVKKLGLENQIIFPGELSANQLCDLYTQCQFAIIPSLSETFGFCISEPLMMGKIVISNKVGIASDIIVSDSNGFLYNGQNQLYELILKVLSMPQEKILKISASAYDTSQYLTWDKVVAEQSEEFIRLLK
jgi:glycosyltransferase involved in cell wall biosynthesis